jgi:hypothetical protein
LGKLKQQLKTLGFLQGLKVIDNLGQLLRDGRFGGCGTHGWIFLQIQDAMGGLESTMAR